MKFTQTTPGGAGHIQRLLFGFLVWVIALFAISREALADDLAYSKLDEATVRIFLVQIDRIEQRA